MSGTITALEIQKRHASRVNVYLDDEFAFGISATEAAALHVGQFLSDAAIEALQTGDMAAHAMDRALNLLASRARSIYEIRQALEKGTNPFPEPVIESTLAKLASYGYVDDRAFAEAWVASRQSARGMGVRALAYELRNKGIDQSLIDEVLAAVNADEAAARALQGQARKIAGLDRRAAQQKLSAFLARRGFDYDIIRAAVDRFLAEQAGDGRASPLNSGDDDTADWE